MSKDKNKPEPEKSKHSKKVSDDDSTNESEIAVLANDSHQDASVIDDDIKKLYCTKFNALFLEDLSHNEGFWGTHHRRADGKKSKIVIGKIAKCVEASSIADAKIRSIIEEYKRGAITDDDLEDKITDSANALLSNTEFATELKDLLCGTMEYKNCLRTNQNI